MEKMNENIVDKYGVEYSADGRRLLCAPYSLTSYAVKPGTEKIEGRAFYCYDLKEIEIPSSVTEIGYGAFSACRGLEKITVDEGNKRYDSRGGCNAIIDSEANELIAGCKNTVIPATVTKIGDRAFCDCWSLEKIEIPDSVTEIGEYAFYESSLEKIEIPSSVTRIGYGAFSACTGLKKIAIPNSVTEIGEYTFVNCYGLKEIEIPSSVTKIGNEAFSVCTGLEKITVDEGNKRYDSRGGCNAIIDSETNELILGSKNTVIPATVTKIGKNAFRYVDFKTIEIPDSVTEIGEYAFYESSLEKIEIPSSVTEIGHKAFSECYGLKEIEIPSSVTMIGYEAFSGCRGLEKITVDEGNKRYDSRGGCNAIIDSETNELIADCKKTVVPASVRNPYHMQANFISDDLPF